MKLDAIDAMVTGTLVRARELELDLSDVDQSILLSRMLQRSIARPGGYKRIAGTRILYGWGCERGLYFVRHSDAQWVRLAKHMGRSRRSVLDLIEIKRGRLSYAERARLVHSARVLRTVVQNKISDSALRDLENEIARHEALLAKQRKS